MIRAGLVRSTPSNAGGHAVLIAAGLTSAIALRTVLGGSDPATSTPAAAVFVAALAALALAAGVRIARPRPFALAVGVVGGVVLVAGSLFGRPVVAWHPIIGVAQLLLWTPLVAAVAAAEEAVIRGALFHAVEGAWGVFAAVAVTTAAFALIHVPLYGLGALPLDLAAGLWLGGLRVLTGGIAAPIAAHVVADLGAGWLG